MERLTHNYNAPLLKAVPTKIDLDFILSLDDKTSNGIMDIVDKLAAYEDAEEQGLLVKLPCTPGTRIYLVASGRILEYNFMGIVQFLNYKPTLFGRQGFGNYVDVQIANVEQWGVTVFANREEAEKVLNGGKK